MRVDQSTAELLPHRGRRVLTFAVLGVFLFPFGFAAWVMGHHDCYDMEHGRMDSSGRPMTEAGRILGMTTSLLGPMCVVCEIVFNQW